MPKIVDTDSVRFELAQVTWHLIAEEGLESTTMRRIAQKANCTTGLVTHYFASKEELLLAAARQVRTEVQEHRAYLRELDPGLPVLREYLLTMLPLDETREHYWRVWLSLWNQANMNAKLAKEWLHIAELGKRGIRKHLEDALAQGHLRADIDLDVEVTTLNSLIYGLALDLAAREGRKSKSAVRVVDSYLEKVSKTTR